MYHLMFNDSSSNELQQQVCLLASALHPRRLLPQIMGLLWPAHLRRPLHHGLSQLLVPIFDLPS